MLYSIDCILPEIAIAHRLINGYRGKCNNLHGHNYKVSVSLGANSLDKLGFVADFSEIKKIYGNWLLEYWDHVTLLVEDDAKLLEFLQKEQMRHYILLGYCNTTAEILAEYLFNRFAALIQEINIEIELMQVNVAENSKSSASYRLKT